MGKNRYCVIMAGGVGSRFWPFSRADRPKQFLDLFGMGRSLLRMAYDRFATVVPRENIFISTHEQYVDLVMEQLPEVPRERILAEVQRRNTAPCGGLPYPGHRSRCHDDCLSGRPSDSTGRSVP